MDRYIIAELPITDFLYLCSILKQDEPLSRFKFIDKMLRKRYKKKLLKSLDKISKFKILLKKRSVEELIDVMYLDIDSKPENIFNIKETELHSGHCYSCDLSYEWGNANINSIAENEKFDIKLNIKNEEGYFSFTFSNEVLLSETNNNAIQYLDDINATFLNFFDTYVRKSINE